MLELLLAGRWKFNPPLRFNLTLQMFQASKNRRFLAKRDNRFCVVFVSRDAKMLFEMRWFPDSKLFKALHRKTTIFFFASTAGRKSSRVTAGALGDTLPKKQSGKARVGGLSPDFIYVRFINKHTALLLGVPGAV